MKKVIFILLFFIFSISNVFAYTDNSWIIVKDWRFINWKIYDLDTSTFYPTNTLDWRKLWEWIWWAWLWRTYWIPWIDDRDDVWCSWEIWKINFII